MAAYGHTGAGRRARYSPQYRKRLLNQHTVALGILLRCQNLPRVSPSRQVLPNGITYPDGKGDCAAMLRPHGKAHEHAIGVHLRR